MFKLGKEIQNLFGCISFRTKRWQELELVDKIIKLYQ